MDRDSPPAPSLQPQTLEALRYALADCRRTGQLNGPLTAALTDAAADARGRGMQAEHLLVVLKEIWNAPGPQRGDDASTALLQQVITRCIERYYTT